MFLRYFFGAACLLLVLIGGYLLSLWPQGRGQVRLERLPGPAVIVRDWLGVPLVWADSEDAGFFAMGYAHAQDRLWQMEVLRRAAWGELARIAGDAALPLDVLHRRLGFYRQALSLRADQAGECRLARQYARGITAYLRAHPTRLPPEFLSARLRPALWQEEDVLAIGAMVEWLALPCSTRLQGIPADMTEGGASWSLDSLPPGLRAFLSPIVVDVSQSGATVRCALTWGSQIPSPWVETGLIIGSGYFVRAWCIPGWPLPHVTATIGGLRTCRMAETSPWRKGDVEGWQGVLEFLHDTPTGPCDTVRVSGALSAVSRADEGWWITGGSPRFSARTIGHGREVWLGADPSVAPNPAFRAWPAEAGAGSPTWAGVAHHAAGAPIRPTPHVRYLIHRALHGGREWTHAPGRRVECGPHRGRDAPVSVLVEWESGRLRAVQMGGQSGVMGNLHRVDQNRSWSRSRMLARSMSLPDFSRGCALVPLVS